MMHFNSKDMKENIKLEIDNIALPGVTSTKFLGVWLDNKLYWHIHLNNLLLKTKRVFKPPKIKQKFTRHTYEKNTVLCSDI